MREKNMKTVLVFSGGMDSTTLLYDVLDTGGTVEAIAVNYNQRHKKELECAESICRGLGVKFDVLDLSGLSRFLTGSSQSDATIPVPFGRYNEPSMRQTVVPNRNMFMLAAVGAIAIARKADQLMYGAHSGDHTIYPDCRPVFVEAMRAAFMLSDWHHLGLVAPYLQLTKGQIARRGLFLDVPYQMTWTCYVGDTVPCQQCGACTERAEAFEFCGAPDPLLEVLR